MASNPPGIIFLPPLLHTFDCQAAQDFLQLSTVFTDFHHRHDTSRLFTTYSTIFDTSYTWSSTSTTVITYNMAYTQKYMSPTIPERSSLPSIGSVETNFSRSSADTEENDTLEFLCYTPEADSIRTIFGDDAYEDYIAGLVEKRNSDALKAAKRASLTLSANTSSTAYEEKHKLRRKLKALLIKIIEAYKSDI